ncbi:MAG: hypothetical protein LBU83_12010 [Bacteroidales bacterium]|nr:hypothetical protein [Bacteroidales bacterium]
MIKLLPLDGYYEDSQIPKFSLKGWFDGSFQETGDKFLNDHFGFRSFFIRLNHQWRFSFFNKAKTQWVTVGKENYLYEENYINARYGTDFIGEDSIAQRMYKFKSLQDTLNQLGKKFFMVLAPGKGCYYPEYIPDQYHREIGTTNISVYRKYIEKWDLNCIDFHRYFIDNKETSPYPFYPQYGIHWSVYAMHLALDSIVRYVENECNITMPHIYWDEIIMSQPDKFDSDISKAMNLLFTPRSFEMAYPKVQIESDSGKTKPSLLVIGDSFYGNMYHLGWDQRLFSNYHFWYYNKEIYPENAIQWTPTEGIDLLQEIMKYDIIFILSTDSNLPNLGWGFIEEAYGLFF